MLLYYAQMLLVLILRGSDPLARHLARNPRHRRKHAQNIATGQATQLLSALPREYSSAICETMRSHESVNSITSKLERGNARVRRRL